MTKRNWSLIILTLFFAFVLSACGNDGEKSSATAKKTTIKIGFQKGNTLNILKARGTLEERLKTEGIKVQWLEFPIGTALLEGLNTNQIDFGHASDANGVFSQASGKPSLYVASDTPYQQGVALIVKQDSTIKNVEDFKGKKIGVTKGGNMHYLLIKALKSANLTVDDVDLIYYKDAAEGRATFETDQIDVLGIWDPFLAVLESGIATRTIVNAEGLTDNRTFYFASEKFADDHPDLISIILDEVQKSDQWANDNTAEVAGILAKELKIDEGPLEVANARRTFGVLPIDEAAISAQQDLADTFHSLGLFPDPVDIESVTNKDADWYPESVK